MSHDHSDDDVIVISEDEARYETLDEDGAVRPGGAADADPGADADPDTHPATEPVAMMGSAPDSRGDPGMATADRADSAARDTPADGTVNGNGTGNRTGSAIPMPGSSATPGASATPAPPAAPGGNWPQIQALFVDDPLAAVQQAADVVGGALAALTAAASNREQTLRGGWQGDGTGTEDLRTALREYRDLAGRLSTLAQDL